MPPGSIGLLVRSLGLGVVPSLPPETNLFGLMFQMKNGTKLNGSFNVGGII